jgi:hypothetical protein
VGRLEELREDENKYKEIERYMGKINKCENMKMYVRRRKQMWEDEKKCEEMGRNVRRWEEMFKNRSKCEKVRICARS